MKTYVKRYLRRKLRQIKEQRFKRSHRIHFDIFRQFHSFSMIPEATYVNNLTLVQQFTNIKGAVVECGTWRGGMIAGMAAILGDERSYYLYDSFEGLPDAKAIDGKAANEWQQDKTGPDYHDNCKAEMEYAATAMKAANVSQVHIVKGWFAETLPAFDKTNTIAVLRLDADWYESTMECLDHLYDAVAVGGVVIIDDYYAWDGCTRAVHEFLSKRGLADRVRQWHDDHICYITKEGSEFTKA